MPSFCILRATLLQIACRCFVDCVSTLLDCSAHGRCEDTVDGVKCSCENNYRGNRCQHCEIIIRIRVEWE